ncbi:MAG: hypothetical protein PHE49_11935 [bacterium]|nr:hypothetical protein [bacterium]
MKLKILSASGGLILSTILFCQTPVFSQENPFYLKDYQSIFSPGIRLEKLGTETQPPFNSSKVLIEIAYGTLAGGLCGLLGIIAADAVTPDKPDDIQHSDASGELMTIVVGFIVGYPIGSAIGVYWAGSSGDETGSFIATMAGSILGTLLFVLPAPIGATLAFNATRRYKNPGGSSLINMEDGKINLALPEIYLKKDFTDNARSVRSISLATIGF